MADVKINLEASHKDFVASLAAATKSAQDLVRGLEGLSTKHSQTTDAANKTAEAEKKASTAMDQTARSTQSAGSGHTLLGASIAKTILLYTALIGAAIKAGETMAHGFTAAIQNIDDFRRQTIGTAVAITNLSDPIQNAGRTWDSVFNQNLKATTATFIQLESISKRYFATAADLQLAYNQFAQRGIVLRRSELEQLAQLTTMILLLTGGQNSAIQVQEEIRDLITGTLRPTAQLAQQLRSFGLDVKAVGQEIRATQSLAPLTAVLQGAKAATGAIQETFTAALNGFLTISRQISRVGFEGMFKSIVAGLKDVTNFLTANKESIAGTLGVIGKVVSDVVKETANFAKVLFSSNTAAKDGTNSFLDLVAAVEVLGINLLKVTELLLLLIRDLPLAIDAFRAAFDEKTTEKTVTTLDKMKTLILDMAKATPFGQFVLGILKLKGVSEETREAILKMIPGADIIRQSTEGLKAIGKIVEEDINKVSFKNPVEEFKKLRAEIQQAQDRSVKGAAGLGVQSPDQNAPTQIPFKATPEQEAALKHLTDALRSAEDRLARARRTAEEIAVQSQIQIDLQGLQRDLTLIEQGFVLDQHAVVGLRSAVTDLNVFIGDNLKATVLGADANFKTLGNSVADTFQQISGATIDKLRETAARASDGINQFRATVADVAAGLKEAEVAPHLIDAKKIRDEADGVFDRIAKRQAETVAGFQDALEKAIAKGNPQDIILKTSELEAAKAAQFSSETLQRQVRAFEESKALVQDQIAATNALRIAEQSAGQIAAENRRIQIEQLKIRQQINVEAGKFLQLTQTVQNSIVQFNQQTDRSKPRTQLEILGGAIQEQREKFTFDIAEAQGRLAALQKQVEDLAVPSQVLGSIEADQASQLRAINIPAQQKHIEALKESADAAIKNAETVKAFTFSWAAIINAVRGSLNVLSDSLLAAFEGKQTNFVQAFKGVTDKLFKDSLEPVFQKLEVAAARGFTNVFKSLKIENSMAETLGPAFLAGFALIASFVLGSLLSGSHNTASAANPQVGIQSSEQVRGLIGGQTQIPIGLVGESLQNALVPTNFLLTRIASGIDRIGGVNGGVSAATVESIVSRAVSDAVQTQG